IKNNIYKFNKIYIFNNKNSTLDQWYIKKYLKKKIDFENNIHELIEVDFTDNKTLDFLNLLTSHNGCLNVVYVSSDTQLIMELIDLFPKPYRIGCVDDNLGILNEADKNNFRKLLDKLDDDSFGITTMCEETVWMIIGNEILFKQIDK
ncbi:MAG: hypothetical protein ABIJ12_04405, partial [bacterium]